MRSFSLLLLITVPSLAAAFNNIPPFLTGRTQNTNARSLQTCLSASFADPVPNEFARPLNTDRILKTSAGKQRRGSREYRVEIEAEDVECMALAKRFELKDIDSLTADLSISAPYAGTGSGNLLTVQVDGTIRATVTRTCVRTNEDFDVDLEIPLSCIVKPVANTFTIEDFLNSQESQEEDLRPQGKKSKKKLKADKIHNMNDMMELQQMINKLQDDETFTGEDELIEDESIYSLETGNLDVGELVAQTFWLNLDPYPKKPGTGPVEYSISG